MELNLEPPISSQPFSAPIWQLLDSSTIGGIERHVALLAAALTSSGFPSRVVLLADHGDNPWFEQLRTAGVPFDILGGGLANLKNAVQEHRPALIHTHGYKAGVLGRIAGTLSHIPLVSTYHAGERGAFPVNLYQWLDEQTGFLAKQIAVSRPIADQIGDKARLIANFVSMPDAPPAKTLPQRIGFIGRLSDEKGPDVFCELARRFPEYDWNIYGDGPMRRDLENRYGEDVKFHGIITDLSGVWQELGLVAITSRAEGLPLVCLESLAAGIPVLASRVGALPDVLKHGETGWLVEPDNIDEAAAAIEAWASLGNERHENIRLECREAVARQYSAEARLPDILDVYRHAGLRR